MDISAFVDIPTVVLVYFIIEVIKKNFMKTDRQRSLLPTIAAAIGAVLCIGVFVFFPSISTNSNALTAFASGALSGMAATGTNQIYKQIIRFFTPNMDSEE